MVRRVKVAVVGFGTVGRSLVRLITLRGDVLERKYGIRVSIVAIVDSKGAAVNSGGFSAYDLMRLCEVPRSRVSSYGQYGIPDASIVDVYERVTPDVHVEVTPSNYQDGEPGFGNVMYAIESGVNVVSANKGPFALKYREVTGLAERKGVRVRFKATVMAGTPLIDLLMGLKGYEIDYVEGILNATTNFILTEMQDKLISYEEALDKAKALGIAETDPSVDVKGLDAAAKLVIISNVIGSPVSLSSIGLDDLSTLKVSDVYSALREGKTIKYVARLDIRERRGQVRIRKVPRDSIFGSTSGTLNAVRIVSDVNEISIVGYGGGGLQTAHALLDDIITVSRDDQP